MMSQSKFVVVVTAVGALPLVPSRPFDVIAYVWPAASLSNTQAFPHPSFAGIDLMYVGESMVFIVAFGTTVVGTNAPAALYLLTSVARASHAVAMVRMSAIERFCFARCMAVSRLGIAIAARMPMIATTISSSMSVKPFWFFLII